MDKTKIAVDVFDKLAELYQEKFMDLDLYNDTFDTFCNAVAGKKILELACGPGNITRYLLNKRPDLEILGTDLSPNMIRLAKINNPEAGFQLLDCRNMDMLNQKFDAIMCGFCLPYLNKEEAIKLISDAAGTLNPGGILYISTMEDDYSKSGFKTGSTGDEVYMHYHEAGYLTAALIENNFTLIDMKRQDYPEKDGSKTTDLILIAKL